jgi:hypothetical protein
LKKLRIREAGYFGGKKEMSRASEERVPRAVRISDSSKEALVKVVSEKWKGHVRSPP